MNRLLSDPERLGALLILCLALFYLLHALHLDTDPTATMEIFNSRSMPIGLALCSIAVSLLQIALGGSGDGENEDGGLIQRLQGFDWRAFGLLTLCMTLYALLFSALGFLLAGTLFLMASFRVLGERRLWLGATVAFGLVFSLWLALTGIFGIYLDGGLPARLLESLSGG